MFSVRSLQAGGEARGHHVAAPDRFDFLHQTELGLADRSEISLPRVKGLNFVNYTDIFNNVRYLSAVPWKAVCQSHK